MNELNISSENDSTDGIPVRSPCISICCLDDDDVCLGCFRHIDEVVGWHSANNEQRRKIMENALERQVKD